MTSTDLNAGSTKMIEQIFANIDAIGLKMESTVDLVNDVSPFMSSTLAKIKLLTGKEDNYEAQYELFQIATNYLPRTIDAYCALPIEYRNTREIKAGKTARQILIEDLKIFKNQLIDIEKQVYANIESQIKVNSNFVKAKYEKKFALADNIENMEENGFINQFDYKQYTNSEDYKDIKFKKVKTEKELAKKERIEYLNKGFVAVKNGAVFSYDWCNTKWKKNKEKIFDIIDDIFGFLGAIFPVLFGIGLFIGVISLFIMMISTLERPKGMFYSMINSAQGIHSVMKVSMIPNQEFSNFVSIKEKAMLDSSSFREENMKAITNEKDRTVTIQVVNLDKNYCLRTIDAKELSFDASNVKVNGIPLPQDNTTSNYVLFQNENHKLCHLESGNKVEIELNNQKINDYGKFEKAMPKAEKIERVKQMQNEVELMKLELNKVSKKSREYDNLSAMIQQVESAIVVTTGVPIYEK